MSRSFGSAALLAAAMVSALGCYTISLKVSAERAGVDKIRAGTAADMRDIRMLQSELRTRARMPELQRWNDTVLALRAPTAHQFIREPVQLAAYATHDGALAPRNVVAVPKVQPAIVRTAPAAEAAAPPAPSATPPARPLVPGIRTIAYSVPSRTAPASAATAAVQPQHAAAQLPHAAAPVTAGLDADLVSSVEAAAAGAAVEPPRKAPMQ